MSFTTFMFIYSGMLAYMTLINPTAMKQVFGLYSAVMGSWGNWFTITLLLVTLNYFNWLIFVHWLEWSTFYFLVMACLVFKFTWDSIPSASDTDELT